MCISSYCMQVNFIRRSQKLHTNNIIKRRKVDIQTWLTCGPNQSYDCLACEVCQVIKTRAQAI